MFYHFGWPLSNFPNFVDPHLIRVLVVSEQIQHSTVGHHPEHVSVELVRRIGCVLSEELAGPRLDIVDDGLLHSAPVPLPRPAQSQALRRQPEEEMLQRICGEEGIYLILIQYITGGVVHIYVLVYIDRAAGLPLTWTEAVIIIN